MQTESVRYLGTGVAIYLGTVDANGTALALALTCAAQDGSRASRLRDAMMLRREEERNKRRCSVVFIDPPAKSKPVESLHRVCGVCVFGLYY